VRERRPRKRRDLVAIEIEFSQIPEAGKRVHADVLDIVAPQKQFAEIFTALQKRTAQSKLAS